MEARIELIGVAQMILRYVGLKPSPSGLVDPVVSATVKTTNFAIAH